MYIFSNFNGILTLRLISHFLFSFLREEQIAKIFHLINKCCNSISKIQHRLDDEFLNKDESWKSDRNEHQQPENHSSIEFGKKTFFRKSPLKSLIYDFVTLFLRRIIPKLLIDHGDDPRLHNPAGSTDILLRKASRVDFSRVLE